MAIRRNLYNIQHWGVAHNTQIHYLQQRPMAMPRFETAPFAIDCSGWVTTVCRWGGAPDPNGFHYDGYGNTETMMSHLAPIAKEKALWGDLVIFGNPGHTVHVAMLIESCTTHANPNLVSHGNSRGPVIISLNAMVGYFWHLGYPAHYKSLGV